MTEKQVIARMRKHVWEEKLRKAQCMAELKERGLLAADENRNRKQWIADVMTILKKHNIDPRDY